MCKVVTIELPVSFAGLNRQKLQEYELYYDPETAPPSTVSRAPVSLLKCADLPLELAGSFLQRAASPRHLSENAEFLLVLLLAMRSLSMTHEVWQSSKVGETAKSS